mgnify:CR=1 FL=1
MKMAESMAKCGQLLQAIAFQTALLQPEFHLFAFAELRTQGDQFLDERRTLADDRPNDDIAAQPGARH